MEDERSVNTRDERQTVKSGNDMFPDQTYRTNEVF